MGPDPDARGSAATALVDDLTAQVAEAAVEWAASPRTLRDETALERAIREAGGMTFEDTRVAFLKGIQEREISARRSASTSATFGTSWRTEHPQST